MSRQGCKTHYIPWKRAVLELSGVSLKGVAQGTSDASRKHWSFLMNITGLISLVGGRYPMYAIFTIFWQIRSNQLVASLVVQ